MKTSGSRKWSASRIRSPSSAPCENGLDGSTETTPTLASVRADVADEGGDEGRLSDAGRAGQAERVGAAGVRVEIRDDLVGERVGVLDERDRPRERAPVAAADAGGESLASPVTAAGHRADASARTPRPVPAACRARRRRSAPRASMYRAIAATTKEIPARRPHPARAADVEQRARPGRCRPREEIGRAHHERQRATAHHVRCAALHEQRVADDRRAVTEAADDAADRRDPDVRADRRAAEPDRHQRERARRTRARSRSARATPLLEKLPNTRPVPIAPYRRP